MGEARWGRVQGVKMGGRGGGGGGGAQDSSGSADAFLHYF